MKIGDLVRETATGDVGIVLQVRKDYYGAPQAFKVYKDVKRDQCIRPDMVDGFGPTKDGVSDRIQVAWTRSRGLRRSTKKYVYEYVRSDRLEVMSENR